MASSSRKGGGRGLFSPLRNLRDLLCTAVRSTNQGILHLDTRGKITFANPAAERILGYGAQELMSLADHSAIHADRQEGHVPSETDCPFLRTLVDGRERRAWSQRLRRKDGSLLDAECLCIPLKRAGRKPSGVVLLFTDASAERRLFDELQAANRALQKLSLLDPQTEALNRQGVERALAAEIQRARRRGAPLTAILAGLDDFAPLNGTLGHSVGDVVLREVAAKIKTSLRPTDHLARVGGDEFLILLPETLLAEGVQVAERLRLSLTESPVELAAKSLKITASFGAAVLPPEATTLDEVLSLLYPLLRAGKDHGKNQVFPPSDARRPNWSATHQIVEGLRMGVGLRALVQPIVDLEEHHVTAYEFLSRGPAGPFELPNDFFRACLEHRLLTTVDRRCAQMSVAAARRIGPAFSYHINLFPSTLLDMPVGQLVDFFRDRPAHGSYCVEISEQQLIGDPSYLASPVEALKNAGVKIAIDDVGFGRSCLESLILLEPDIVKIDRRCVHGISHDEKLARPLERLLRVCKELGAEAIAEGIEDPADLETLRRHGVRYGQGYLLGRPSEDPITAAAAVR